MSANMLKRKWTFFSNHGIVLAYIVKFPRSTAQEIAQETLLSIRGVQQIISDLEKDSYIEKRKDGRCNHYTVRYDMPLRHRLMREHTIGEVLFSIGYQPDDKLRVIKVNKKQSQIEKRVK